jgi:heavy metal translocating P-type ATPase
MVLSLALNMTPPVYGSTTYWALHGILAFSALLVFLFLGRELIISTYSMMRLRRLSIEGLFMLSLLGAFFGSVLSSLTGTGAVFYEVVSVVIAIHTLGRLLGERSLLQLQAATKNLNEAYDTARVFQDKSWEFKPIELIKIGDRVLVEPGETISVDGVISNGMGYVNESALSGEPLPIVRRLGERLRAGTHSLDGSFEITVEASSGERELDNILKMLEMRVSRPSKRQTQADHLIQYFLPLVASVSCLTFVYWFLMATWAEAVFNAMAVLLVACPCALGLATPVAVWRGLHHFSQLGLLSRDGALLDLLASSKRIFFDKTGTLSEASLQVTECIVLEKWQEQRNELMHAIRAIESKSKHPVANSLLHYLPEKMKELPVLDLEHFPGEGIGGSVNGLRLRIGELSLLKSVDTGELPILHDKVGKQIYVYVDDEVAAIFVLREILREGVNDNWSSFVSLGIEVEVLTGDPDSQLELPESIVVQEGMSAEAKLMRVQASQEAGELPLFVGDGINDSAAMAEASASIAMGSGAELTRSTAQATLLGDRISNLPKLIKLSRAIQARLHSNLIYASIYNLIGMLLASFGYLHPVAAALIMFISSAFVLTRALGRSIIENYA